MVMFEHTILQVKYRKNRSGCFYLDVTMLELLPFSCTWIIPTTGYQGQGGLSRIERLEVSCVDNAEGGRYYGGGAPRGGAPEWWNWQTQGT